MNKANGNPASGVCREIAAGVHFLQAGKGFTRSNVYFVRSGSVWVLIDAASANCGRVIREAAESLFGANTRPASILLTHDHPDHAGSVLELVRTWGCPVYMHPDELPMAAGSLSTFEKYANPLDRWIVLPLLRAMPRRRVDSIISKASLNSVAQAFDPTTVPFLPDWECIPAPGHTPGEVAFLRPSDRVLITGDAVVTVDLNSFWGFLRWGLQLDKQAVSGPPWYSSWNWRKAKESVAVLAGLQPRVLATGHGAPLTGAGVAPELRAFADHFCGLVSAKEGMPKPRRSETDQGITGEFTTQMYDIMMRNMRDKGWIETNLILKQGISSGLALEIGPGPGYLGLEWLKKTTGTRLMGLEISDDMIALANKNATEYGLSDRVEYHQGDAQKMPFGDGYFDAVFTNGSLHEWAHPEYVFNEIARVIKPRGRYVISDLRRDMIALIRWFLWLTVKPKGMRRGLITSINASYLLPEIEAMLPKTSLQGWQVSKNMLGIIISGRKP